MKKQDLMVMCGILGVALVLFAGFFGYKALNKEEERVMGAVIHQEQVILAFDINKDYMYELEGSYGTLFLEVKDQKWRITNEECPNHICSAMGWVGVDDIIPIVCLPNDVYVQFPFGE